jgi:hypothetical protein
MVKNLKPLIAGGSCCLLLPLALFPQSNEYAAQWLKVQRTHAPLTANDLFIISNLTQCFMPVMNCNEGKIACLKNPF